MKIIKMNAEQRVQMVDPCNTGDCLRQGITDGLSQTLRAAMIKFPHGDGNKPHTHVGDQLLIVVDEPGCVSEGLIRTEHGEEYLVHAGDCVFFPAGEVHSHGAAPGKDYLNYSFMSITPDMLGLKSYSNIQAETWEEFFEKRKSK